MGYITNIVWRYQSLALEYLATFSGVGGGNNSGVNNEAFFIPPLILILPLMKAFYGLRVPKHTASKSLSVIVKVASAYLSNPTLTFPYPFLRSIIQLLIGFPFFSFLISKLKTA